MTVRGEEHDSRARIADAQLNPTLLGVEDLVRRHLESQFLGIELECAVLIAGWNADEFDLGNHAAGSPWCSWTVRNYRIFTGRSITIITIVINDAALHFGQLRDRCPHAGPGGTRSPAGRLRRVLVLFAPCSKGQAGHAFGQPSD